MIGTKDMIGRIGSNRCQKTTISLSHWKDVLENIQIGKNHTLDLIANILLSILSME